MRSDAVDHETRCTCDLLYAAGAEATPAAHTAGRLGTTVSDSKAERDLRMYTFLSLGDYQCHVSPTHTTSQQDDSSEPTTTKQPHLRAHSAILEARVRNLYSISDESLSEDLSLLYSLSRDRVDQLR